MKNRAAVVFASGFLSGDNPAFETRVDLDDGGTFPIPVDNFLPDDEPVEFLAANNSSQSTELFPHPAACNVAVKVKGMSENNVNISVVNLLGQKLLQKRFTESSSRNYNNGLDNSNLKNGSYFMRLQVDGSSVETIPFHVARQEQ